jgi:NAD(P)-dependent dehydrogenase (short-subunit alcohol dehydrogenase family)
MAQRHGAGEDCAVSESEKCDPQIGQSWPREAFSVYSATKAAMRSFARCWTSDLRHRKIRVNALSPGPIETRIFGKSGLTREQLDEFKANVMAAVPLGRMGTPDEIAKAAVFLPSGDSSYVTGIEVFVDGGMAQV